MQTNSLFDAVRGGAGAGGGAGGGGGGGGGGKGVGLRSERRTSSSGTLSR